MISMNNVAQQAKIQMLIARLRNLETECIRLSAIDLPVERSPLRSAYEERLQQLENSHSQSWFGDHSATYYDGFRPPPPGRSFDVEWGFVPGFHGSRNSGWRIYSRDEIREFTFLEIGEEIFFEINKIAKDVADHFSGVRDQALDIMEMFVSQLNFASLSRYTERLENKLKPYQIVDYINARIKSAPRMTRDSEEIAKGQAVPAHVQYQASIQSLKTNKTRLHEFAGVLRNVIEAVMLHEPVDAADNMSNRIFIGHGRSEQWRVLKDFIVERLGMPYEEFNRISPAGINTQERLSEMLDRCGFAFLVLSAEDLHGDGSMHARENVIHEAGLFQGRMGWRKAIVLLEQGCEEFSNINGLGQIRFPKDNIAGCFEDLRRVLERESLLLE